MSIDAGRGDEAVAVVERAWNLAARRWDADALAAVYTPDALFFGGRPGHFVGCNSIREYFASYEGVIVSGTVKLVDQSLVEVTPQCFLSQGYAEFSFLLAGNESTRSRVRATFMLVRQGDVWKIRQHHVSASPIEPPLGQSQ